jgi:hypothetical protein
MEIQIATMNDGADEAHYHPFVFRSIQSHLFSLLFSSIKRVEVFP